MDEMIEDASAFSSPQSVNFASSDYFGNASLSVFLQD
jgi:hypothetical protein